MSKLPKLPERIAFHTDGFLYGKPLFYAAVQTVSIIIPTLNEAESLPGTLDALSRLSPPPEEIIIADGGSTDATRQIARSRGIRFIACTTCGRALQMNTGAAHAGGSVLYFLHADTHPPEEAVARIRDALNNASIIGGGFCRRFRSRHPFLWASASLSDWRSRLFGLFLGDQSFFLRGRVFFEGGQYRDIYPFEDYDLCRRIKKHGKLIAITPPVISSARRFQCGGVVRTLCRDALLTLRYFLSNPRRP